MRLRFQLLRAFFFLCVVISVLLLCMSEIFEAVVMQMVAESRHELPSLERIDIFDECPLKDYEPWHESVRFVLETAQIIGLVNASFSPLDTCNHSYFEWTHLQDGVLLLDDRVRNWTDLTCTYKLAFLLETSADASISLPSTKSNKAQFTNSTTPVPPLKGRMLSIAENNRCSPRL